MLSPLITKVAFVKFELLYFLSQLPSEIHSTFLKFRCA
jgi:hypothetical protein